MQLRLPQLLKRLERKGFTVKTVPISDWDDELPSLLEEDGFEVGIENNIVTVDGRAELSYVDISKDGKTTRWLCCWEWVPLWQIRDWNDCFAENWRDLYPGKEFFAIPATSQESEFDEEVGRLLTELGVAVGDLEGF